MVNLNFEWRHSEEKDGNSKEHYLNIPIKVVNSVDNSYGYSGHLICNKCESELNQFYICSNCSDKEKIGEITKRKDDKTELIYQKAELEEYMKNEVDKTLRVIDEIQTNTLFRKIEHFEKTYEIYNTDDKVSPVINKIYQFLVKQSKALVCEFGYSNRGKSNKLGGILIAGNGKLLLVQLRDYRLIRQPKQEGLQITQEIPILNTVSESQYPEMYENFLKAVENGEKIEVTIKQKPKIMVEVPDFL